MKSAHESPSTPSTLPPSLPHLLLQAMKNVSWFQSAGVVHEQNLWEICRASIVQAEESRGIKNTLVFYFLNFKGASPRPRGRLKAARCWTRLELLSAPLGFRVLMNIADPFRLLSRITDALLEEPEPPRWTCEKDFFSFGSDSENFDWFSETLLFLLYFTKKSPSLIVHESDGARR